MEGAIVLAVVYRCLNLLSGYSTTALRHARLSYTQRCGEAYKCKVMPVDLVWKLDIQLSTVLKTSRPSSTYATPAFQSQWQPSCPHPQEEPPRSPSEPDRSPETAQRIQHPIHSLQSLVDSSPLGSHAQPGSSPAHCCTSSAYTPFLIDQHRL